MFFHDSMSSHFFIRLGLGHGFRASDFEFRISHWCNDAPIYLLTKKRIFIITLINTISHHLRCMCKPAWAMKENIMDIQSVKGRYRKILFRIFKLLIVIIFTLPIGCGGGGGNGVLPLTVGYTLLSLHDAARNRTVAAEAYYPAESPGNDAVPAQGVFPVIIFGHGYTIGVDKYAYLWESLVPEGFIVILPATEGSLLPDHKTFAEDMVFLIEKISELNADPDSLFYQHVSEKTALMGHSMGGGAAFLATAMTTEVTTLVTFAAAETNPSAIQAAASVTVPTLVLAGLDDCVTPPENHQLPLFEALSANCRTYLALVGAGHCQFAENDGLCVWAETSSGCSPAISLEQQETLALSLTREWLFFFLKNETSAWQDFETLIQAETIAGTVIAENQCPL